MSDQLKLPLQGFFDLVLDLVAGKPSRAPRRTDPSRAPAKPDPSRARGDSRARVDVEGRVLEAEFVRHRRARHYILRFRDNGHLRVTIPRGGSREEAERFLHARHAWIAREVRQRLAAVAQSGPWQADAATQRRLRHEAEQALPARLAELAAEHGFDVKAVSIRNQRTRWGSCSPTGRITLNWRLVQVPPVVCDYVMLHELAHLRHLNHSTRFWKEVARICPDYRESRAWLRRNGRLLTTSAVPEL